jgi:hypothetical protein
LKLIARVSERSEECNVIAKIDSRLEWTARKRAISG